MNSAVRFFFVLVDAILQKVVFLNKKSGNYFFYFIKITYFICQLNWYTIHSISFFFAISAIFSHCATESPFSVVLTTFLCNKSEVQLRLIQISDVMSTSGSGTQQKDVGITTDQLVVLEM